MKPYIIKELLSKEIIEIRVMSFYIELKQICEIIAIYIKTENEYWYKLVISDGISKVEKQLIEPEISPLSNINDEFAYPIKKLEKFDFNGKIKNIKKYLYNGLKDECFGIYFELENSINFSVIENNDCLKIINGFENNYDKNYTLVNY